jgi:cyclin-dependent kinase 3
VGIPAFALRQISILQELKHKNLVNLLHVVQKETRLELVFEYVKQDLKTALDSHGPYAGTALKRIIFQLLSGLHFCHSHRIMHRDLTLSGIRIEANGDVKISEFDLAREVMPTHTHTYTHEVVTLWYRAPEVLLGEPHYSPAIDLWSVGCIMAQLALGRVLFRGDSEISQLFHIFRVLGTPDDMNDLWPGVSRLPDFQDSFPSWEPQDMAIVFPTVDALGRDLLALLRYAPCERISAAAALAHPWFANLTADPPAS